LGPGSLPESFVAPPQAARPAKTKGMEKRREERMGLVL
jgi:hypothetical protein